MRSGNHRSSAHALVRPLRPARARCKDAPLTLLASRHDAGRYGLRGRQPGEQTARLVVGTGVTKVTRRLQSDAASSRAALRGFRAALPAALRCRPGSPARFQGCRQGSPALAAWQPCAPRLAALLAFPGSPALASRQPCAAAALPPGSPARQPCAAALRGSPARHRQPCAAAPGVACFARFGAGRVPRPFTLRTLKTVTARKARLTCADAGLPCTAAPAARRAPAARCAPVTAQPCAGSPAALRWQQGSPARQQGCWAGSAAPPDLRQPWAEGATRDMSWGPRVMFPAPVRGPSQSTSIRDQKLTAEEGHLQRGKPVLYT